MNTHGKVFKYPDNVDTDVIIPARYLNTSDAAELAAHCMEDIDTDFVIHVKNGDVMVAGWNFGCFSGKGVCSYPGNQWLRKDNLFKYYRRFGPI